MDPITLNLRVGREPPASEPGPGALSAAEIDANFTALRTAADQLDAEKFGRYISATAPDPAVRPVWLTPDGDLFVHDGEAWFEVVGKTGPAGATGENGNDGADGAGVPTGGSTGQVLTKTSATDFATEWATPSGGGSPGGTDGQVQFNNEGALGGATNVGIQGGDLALVAHEPGALPTAGTAKLFMRSVANRILPAYVGPSGLDSTLQPLLARNKVGWFNPPGNATTVHVLGLVATATGTATAANVATTNIHTAMRRLEYAVTTAAATAVAGLRSSVLQLHIGDPATPFGGFTFISRFGPSRGVASNATRRFFAGMTSITAAPTDVEPSTWAANGVGVGADAGDTNWQIMHRTGTGAMTKVDTGIAKAYADTSQMFEVAIFTAPTGTASVGVQFTRLSDGVSFTHTITTNLPTATQLLTWQIWNSVGGTSSVVGLSVASIYIETDY
jgi:hypothetical protein